MMRILRSPTIAVLGIGAAILVPSSVAQQQPAGTFGGTVEVRVVNLQAVVTGPDGKRVDGLTLDDFRLLVDGKEVPIDYFSEIREGALAPTEVQGTTPLAQPPSLVVDGPEATVGTSYLVFIDEYFPLKVYRDRSLGQVAGIVSDLGPSDSMAVVAYDGSGVEKLSDWTSSRDTLNAVLAEAAQRKTGGVVRRWEAEDIESDTEMIVYVKRLREQTESAVAAATSAMRAVRPPVGRKVMVLLSGGWPLEPARLLTMDDERYIQRRNLGGGPELFQPLVDTANLLGWTLYPADVTGLVAEGIVDEAAVLGFDFDDATDLRLQDPGPGAPTDPADSGAEIAEPGLTDSPDQSIAIDPPPVRAGQRELEDQYAMRLIADTTGGKALIHESVGGVLQDTRSYYWLGFSPPVTGDDQRHDIRLEVTRPGFKVRARSSFVDFAPGTQTTMRVETALLSGGSGGDGDLRVKVGEIQQAQKKRVMVPLEITIPTDEVTAVNTADGYEIRVELRAAAMDDWGRPSEIPVIPIVFQSPNPPAPGGYATYKTAVELRKNTHDVLVTIYDPTIDHLLAKRLTLEY